MTNITSFLNNIKGFKPLLHIPHYRNDRMNSIKGQADYTPTEPAGSMPELEIDSAKIVTKSLNVLITEVISSEFICITLPVPRKSSRPQKSKP